jgi:hypothetical protein
MVIPNGLVLRRRGQSERDPFGGPVSVLVLTSGVPGAGYPCAWAVLGTVWAGTAGAGPVSGKWQATKWPGASSRGSGASLAHRSAARGQRVRNRQPDGGLTGDGGSPRRVAVARAAPGSVEGMESSSALV